MNKREVVRELEDIIVALTQREYPIHHETLEEVVGRLDELIDDIR